MNKNDKVAGTYKHVLLTDNMISIMKEHYLELGQRLDEADKTVQDDNEETSMSPLIYAFTCGQMAELESILSYAGALTKDEKYQSKLFKKE